MASSAFDKVRIGALLALLLGVVGLVAVTIISPDTRLHFYSTPPPAGRDELPLVQRRVENGVTVVHVDWDLPSVAQRAHDYGALTVRVEVTDDSGAQATGADVVLLQGRHFAGRLQVGQDLETEVKFLSGAPLSAFAASPRGGAELSCRVVHENPDDSFLCTGRLSPHLRVEYPPEPTCPKTPEGSLLATAFPEACFGLTALELTRLHHGIDYQPTARADRFRVEDGHGAIWKLAPKPGERARSITLSSHDLLREPALVRALEAALGPAHPRPAAERLAHWMHKNLLSTDKKVIRLFGDDTRTHARLEEDSSGGELQGFELTISTGD